MNRLTTRLMLSMLQFTELITCHTKISAKLHLSHSNRWNPSLQTTSSKWTFCHSNPCQFCRPNRCPVPVPGPPAAVPSLSKPSLVLHCLTRQQATLRLLSGSLTDLGFGEHMLILPSVYLHLGYLNVYNWSVRVQSGSLVGIYLQYKCRFDLSVLWEGDFFGDEVLQHTQTQTKYKDISKTNPFETAPDTDPNILILQIPQSLRWNLHVMVFKIGISYSRVPVSGELFGKVYNAWQKVPSPSNHSPCSQDAKSQAQTLSNKETSSWENKGPSYEEHDGLFRNVSFQKTRPCIFYCRQYYVWCCHVFLSPKVHRDLGPSETIVRKHLRIYLPALLTQPMKTDQQNHWKILT